jgi:hypothetical protein
VTTIDELEQLVGDDDKRDKRADRGIRRRRLLGTVKKAGALYSNVRTWRLHLAAPGVIGAGLISAGVALRFGVWAGLLAAGVFCLRFDSRMR